MKPFASQLQILFLALVALSMFACQRVLPDGPEVVAPPAAAMDLQQGSGGDDPPPCHCITPCHTFSTEHTMLLPKGPYDFGVKLEKTGSCDLSGLLDTKKCGILDRRVILAFSESANPSLNATDFATIHAFDNQGDPMSYEISNDNMRISFPEDGEVYFIWTGANFDRPAPAAAELSSGGICIIGILPDPEAPGPGSDDPADDNG